MYIKYRSTRFNPVSNRHLAETLCSVVISFHSLLSAELKALEETMSVGLSLGTGKNHAVSPGLFQAADPIKDLRLL